MGHQEIGSTADEFPERHLSVVALSLELCPAQRAASFSISSVVIVYSVPARSAKFLGIVILAIDHAQNAPRASRVIVGAVAAGALHEVVAELDDVVPDGGAGAVLAAPFIAAAATKGQERFVGAGGVTGSPSNQFR